MHCSCAVAICSRQAMYMMLKHILIRHQTIQNSHLGFIPVVEQDQILAGCTLAQSRVHREVYTTVFLI